MIAIKVKLIVKHSLDNLHYYLISLLHSPLSALTYASKEVLHVRNLVELTLNKKQKIGVVLKEVTKPDFICEEILHVSQKSFSSKTLNIAKFISEYYVCSLGEALGLFTPLNELQSKDITKLELDLTLSKSQQEAYNFLLSQNKALLFGDTGSGKSEVYIKLIEQTLSENKSAILLMPEIGLTPQMRKRLKKYFGSLIGIWHSKITKKAKEKIISEIEEGKIKVIAGTRSALFLPLNDLGLIIVDEEHDDSYKSGMRPRYNAKDLAHVVAKEYGARLVLGSATPSLASFHNLPFFRLKGTFFPSSKSFIFEKASNEITPKLLEKIAFYVEKKKQVIVFLPTRANFKYIQCQECGTNVTCPFCSVGMSLHVEKNALVCHYCNYTQRIPQKCPDCGCEQMEAKRIGTAQVVKDLQEIFPNSVVEKFDRDEVTTEKKLKEKLIRFNDGQIDVLVGTQMLAKGHDYHNVALSVVLGIDALINRSDFRARERALALSLQIAGRAGRNGQGEVYIQTQNEEFFKRYITDYETFLKDELEFRQELYPPFKRLLKVLVSQKKETKAQEILETILSLTCKYPNLDVIGSGKSDIEKIAGKYRYQILLRSTDVKSILRFAHEAKNFGGEIDIDPLSFS